MKRTWFILPAAAFALCLNASGHLSAQDRSAGTNAPGAHQVYTPPKGDPERNAIMDALREATRSSKTDVVYVVEHLKIKDGWAWVQTNPQSPDNVNHFEPLWSLLQKQGGRWVVLYMRPCCGDCADDPDCNNDRRLYKKLKREFPAAPPEIFPAK